MIACEPTLSQFLYATELCVAYSRTRVLLLILANSYRALCYLTGGSMIPLFTADLLAKVIIGFAVEQVGI